MGNKFSLTTRTHTRAMAWKWKTQVHGSSLQNPPLILRGIEGRKTKAKKGNAGHRTKTARISYPAALMCRVWLGEDLNRLVANRKKKPSNPHTHTHITQDEVDLRNRVAHRRKEEKERAGMGMGCRRIEENGRRRVKSGQAVSMLPLLLLLLTKKDAVAMNKKEGRLEYLPTQNPPLARYAPLCVLGGKSIEREISFHFACRGFCARKPYRARYRAWKKGDGKLVQKKKPIPLSSPPSIVVAIGQELVYKRTRAWKAIEFVKIL